MLNIFERDTFCANIEVEIMLISIIMQFFKKHIIKYLDILILLL